MCSFAIIAMALSALVTNPPVARGGDLETAKQNLEKVKIDLSNATWSSFQDDVKATETFLDGLPAADRDPVQKELDDLKAKGAEGFKDYKSKSVLVTAKRNLDSAAESIPNAPGTVKETLQQTVDLLNSDDAKIYADADQVAKLKSRAQSLQAMADTKVLEFAAPIVKEMDDLMASQPFKDAKTNEEVDHVTSELAGLKSRVNGALEGVPATDPRVLAIQAKMTGYDKVIASAASGAGASQAADQLANQWKGQQEYFAGWDKEGAGPSWDDYIHHQAEMTDHLNMPKTVELLTRLHPWFAEDSVKSVADQYKDNPSVRVTMAKAHKAFDTAATKVHGAFDKIFSDAEKEATPQDVTIRNKASYLADDADKWLVGSSYHDADVARGKKLSDKWNSAVTGVANALKAASEKLTSDATAAWPGISSGIKAEDGFTPDKLDQYKGKVIHITGSNRCGWDYEPGGYRFARKINGMVVAGKYDSNVAAAVDSAVKQTGQDLPDDNWDVYATVEGPGKISERTSTEGKVKVDGQDVGTVTAEGHQTVDCAVLKIIAMHAGPVAVGPGGSSVTGGAAGSGNLATGSAAAAGIFSFFGLLMHLFELALCIAAGGLIVLKNKPALAAQVSGGTTAVKLPGNENLGLLGLGFIVLGVLWLLSKAIIGDLLPAGFLILAGLCVANDWMQAKKLLPANLGNSIKSLSVSIAGATALFGVLHLFLWNWYLL